MQNDLFEKWYSLSFPSSSLERNEDGSYFRRKTNFSLESFEAGQQSKQDEVDELQKRIDDALEKCKTGIRKQGGDYYLELVEGILKGIPNNLTGF